MSPYALHFALINTFRGSILDSLVFGSKTADNKLYTEDAPWTRLVPKLCISRQPGYTFGYLHICGHLSEGLEDAAFVPSVPEVGKSGRAVTGESHLFSLTTNVSEEDTASKRKALGE